MSVNFEKIENFLISQMEKLSNASDPKIGTQEDLANLSFAIGTLAERWESLQKAKERGDIQ